MRRVMIDDWTVMIMIKMGETMKIKVMIVAML